MATLIVERTMLYCPKCQRRYEEGSQRFCNNDGGRLLPVVNSGIKRDAATNGVFTNLLAKTSLRNNEDEKLAKTPRFVKTDNQESKLDRLSNGKLFKSEKESQPKIGGLAVERKPKPQTKPVRTQEPDVTPETKGTATTPTKRTSARSPGKPLSRLIDPSEVQVNQANLGKSLTSPSGTKALSLEHPKVLIGETIKGRYKVVSHLDQDLSSIAFLAEDEMNANRNVCLRVLMHDDAVDDFQNKLLSEERVSLSHINHPNVASVFDSGDLPEGNPFIVTEYFENESVKEYLNKTGGLNRMRTARIIRQSSYALSEVHQNGILHRNLQPHQLLLTISEAGNETVKVTDFCVSDGKLASDNLAYKSPEQLSGQLPTYASDSYSLAVIAYQMLTNRLPFSGGNQQELLDSQRIGFNVGVSELNRDRNTLVDNIFAKALSYNPTERYLKSRDFGEALFNALSRESQEENYKEEAVIVEERVESDLPKKSNKMSIPAIPLGVKSKAKVADQVDFSVLPENIGSDIHIDSNESGSRVGSSKSEIQFDSNASERQGKRIVGASVEKERDFEVENEVVTEKLAGKDSLWKNRSPEPVRSGGVFWTILSVLGLLLLIASVIGVWQIFNSREEPTDVAQHSGESLETKKVLTQGVDPEDYSSNNNSEDLPPGPRTVAVPKDFKYFENSKQSMSPALAKSFRGFTIAYPGKWKIKKFDKNKNKVDDKFLDISYDSPKGTPIESMNVSPYRSTGTFTGDKALFDDLVIKSNEALSKSLNGNYEVVSEGETTLQNKRWKAYQVNFRTKEPGEVDGKKVEVWGRRLWIPVQRPGVKNGFIITMFATSLSDEVKSADDVGKKGELAIILQSFEPDQSY